VLKCVQEAVVASDEKAHLASTPNADSRIALAVYRSGNGWLAYHPSSGTVSASSPSSTGASWLQAVPQMKALAHGLPHLEAHAAFDSADTSDLPDTVPAKAREAALVGQGDPDTNTLPSKLEDADMTAAWPNASMANAAAPPAKLRIDIGWALWDAEAEGSNLQYQACTCA
jgi:hypothetical protein